ncbi:MAG: S9 family peptidase [Pseudomonadota bacterium]
MTQPPQAEQRDHLIEIHGESRNDPYHWLRDPQWQTVMQDPSVLDPAIRDYLEAENSFCQSVMSPLDGLQETLFEEMKGRIKQDDSSVPKPDGAFAYYRRYEEGGQHPIFCRDQDGVETILLDGNKEAEGLDFFKIASCQHSPDHRYLAYAVDSKGSEYHQIRIKDLEQDKLLPDIIEQAQGGVAWAANGKSFFYTVLDDNHRPCKVFHHPLGQEPSDDRLVYEETDPGFFLGLDKTESGRFILISAHDHTTSEIYLVDAGDPTQAPRLVAAREEGVEYSVSDHGEQLFIHTNADDAVDFKIVTTPIADPVRSGWTDWLAHKEGHYVLGLLLFKDYLVRLERVGGLPRIVITAFADETDHEVAFDEAAYDLGLDPGFEFDTPSLRFVYSSMTTPLQVFDYNMESRSRELRKQQEVPSGHDSSDYITQRILAKAPDGREVPVSLLYGKDTPIDGSAPLLLYGYGAYGLSMPASFSTNRLSLVDRGFVYAIAHIRGGSDLGYGWYLDGKLAAKTNSFTDFIAAGEALAAAGYSSPDRIVAQGGSAGGMLMGAVANMRPDLFAGIVAQVPFVDVLNTMCDQDLPLTPPEWPEWGNPLTDLEAYQRIKAYSPYDNVQAKDYPHILVTAGLTDPRVTYWEPAKWVARLRERKTDANTLLLKTNMTAGHAGAAGRFDILKEVALNYAFALMVTGKAG